MPIFVHVLRLALLFQNTFDTFKTLKLPPPSRSARNVGLPSKSALARRKRDMKGCLAVWIIWCSLLLYERNVERVVSIFIPFYDEVKALLLLFFLFTRARGAEPIYLHLIRPVLKPYTSTLDALLDVLRMFGDILFALTSYPIRAILSWLPWINPDSLSFMNVNSDRRHALGPSVDPTPGDEAMNPDGISAKPRTLEENSRRPINGSGEERPSSSSSSLLDPAATGANGVSTTSQYQIWQPPASSFDKHNDLGSYSSASRNPMPETHTEEWRRYPSFPSAYPATPLAPSRNLPAIYGNAGMPQFPSIQEGEEDGESFPSGQGFDQSLSNSRAPRDTGLSGDSVFDHRVQPIAGLPVPTGGDPSVSDEDLSDEDDEFDKTLRTPDHPTAHHFPHFGAFISPHISATATLPIPQFCPKALFMHDSPTTIATCDVESSLASPMDTEMTSPTDSTTSNISLPPVTNPRKRALPRTMPRDKNRKARTRLSPVKRRATGIDKRPTIQPRTRYLPPIGRTTKSNERSDGTSVISETTMYSEDEEDQPPGKKRRVVNPRTKPMEPTTSRRTVVTSTIPTRSSSRLRTTSTTRPARK